MEKQNRKTEKPGNGEPIVIRTGGDDGDRVPNSVGIDPGGPSSDLYLFSRKSLSKKKKNNEYIYVLVPGKFKMSLKINGVSQPIPEVMGPVEIIITPL